MTREFYERLSAPYREDEKKKKRLNYVNKIITAEVFLLYPVMLLYLLISRDTRILRYILVPAVTFVLVTIFRKICNQPRPYEVWDLPPVIPRDKAGQSFPSRHVFSIFIIAMAVFYISKPLGVILLAEGVLLAVVRVTSCVHFVKDVAAGALIAVVLGGIGFFL